MGYILDEFEKEIIKEIKKILSLDEEIDIPLEVPDEERGDFALPCFIFSKHLKKSPVEIAKTIADQIKLSSGTAKQTGPYVNLRVDRQQLIKDTIKKCLEYKDSFGSYPPRDEKIILEHTSANPNGPLHVGRARNPIIGDTLARVYEKMGYEVERQYFVNDIGRQMAIFTWGSMNIDEDELSEPERDKIDYSMVRYYQKANALLENNPEIEDEVREIIHAMEMGDEEVLKIFKANTEKVLMGVTGSLERLNITLDSFKNESDFIVDGSVNEVIKEMYELDSCGREEGALYFEEDGKRTFLTRDDGTNLYPARDLAYHMWKAERGDVLLNVLGEDHKLHGTFLKDALSALNIKPIPQMVFYSFVSFEGQEMSTRKGIYVTLDDLMDTAQEKAEEEILKRRDDLSEKDIKNISEKVGMGAVRFNIIKVQPEKHIDFVWEDAINFQGDTGPFIQYTYARSCGILNKFQEEVSLSDGDISKLNEGGEVKLIKTMAKFPQILSKAHTQNSPHILAKYALELASEFNQFYRDHHVLKSEDKKTERILLVKAYKHVLKSLLDTLGLEAPESM
ncbi:MAG: arginine--tRNA ligase [Candidatus Saliniplasma sp.]